jgi:hypothetical protein
MSERPHTRQFLPGGAACDSAAGGSVYTGEVARPLLRGSVGSEGARR